MTTETGPLRIVPASHLGYPPTPSADDKALPHPHEQLLDAAAGDMIVMHGECIHSGTANTSGRWRPILYQTSSAGWFTDDFNFPTASIFEEAEAAAWTQDGAGARSGFER